jgi:hypothetical protein
MLNLGAKWRGVVKTKLWPLFLKEIAVARIEKESVWVPGQTSTI